MAFTIGGDWIPNEEEKKQKRLGPGIKVFSQKRKQALLTIIKNLEISEKEMQNLTSQLKKSLGCGGSVKDSMIQLQGEWVNEVENLLKTFGHKK